MIQQAKDQTPDTDSLLNRFLLIVERFAYSHPFPVITVSIVVAILSVWVTVDQLTFKTGRGDLVSKDLPYVERHEKYREEFDDFDGMIVVVEDGDPVRMKNFAEALVEKFQAHPESFAKLFYKIDTRYFKDKALLYLDVDELADLGQKLKEHQQFLDDVNASPGLNQLMRSINLEISTGMVESLLTKFLGAEEQEAEGDDSEDLSLLTSLLKGMLAHIQGETDYRSPWKSFLSGEEDSLRQEGYLTSDDGRLLFVLVNINEDETVFTSYQDSVEFARELIADVKKQFPEIQVGLTGEDVIASDEMVTTQEDVKKATAIALAGVAILFIIAFRGVVKPLLAVFCLVVALCWSMGFTTLTVGHLNILSVVFTTILIGLGIDFGIHILGRFREEREAGKEILEALQRTVQGTGRGNFAGAITTAMAFGAMALTDFIGIAELGWIAAGGILLCMLAMILLLPALVTVEERWRKLDSSSHASILPEKSGLEKLFKY
jgi:predicted RND superfamily exporter protein